MLIILPFLPRERTKNASRRRLNCLAIQAKFPRERKTTPYCEAHQTRVCDTLMIYHKQIDDIMSFSLEQKNTKNQYVTTTTPLKGDICRKNTSHKQIHDSPC